MNLISSLKFDSDGRVSKVKIDLPPGSESVLASIRDAARPYANNVPSWLGTSTAETFRTKVLDQALGRWIKLTRQEVEHVVAVLNALFPVLTGSAYTYARHLNNALTQVLGYRLVTS